VVKNAYLSILAATTPASIERHLSTHQHWANGLWARFALVTPEDSLPAWAFWPDPMDIPASLTNRLRRLALDRLPVPDVSEDPATGEIALGVVKPIAVRLEHGVWTAWEAYAKAVSYDLLSNEQVEDRLWACYGRLHTTAIKLAILLACADWAEGGEPTPVITLGHWARAQTIVEGWRGSLHRLLAKSLVSVEEQLEEKILTILRRVGNAGMTLRDIYRQLKIEREMCETVLARLVDDGLVERFTVKTAGRPSVRFRLLSSSGNRQS